MNAELLEQVAQHIEAHPETFLMNKPISWTNPQCGCIGGQALIISGCDLSGSHLALTAQEILGLSEDQADALFYGGPSEMWDRDQPATTRAKLGVDFIRHFIATGGNP